MPAPMDSPEIKKTNRPDSVPVAPMAPMALLPQKRPTTTRSAALKNNDSKLVSMMGMV